MDIKKLKENLIEWIRNTVGDCIVVIGISGGKDSSVTAALCVEALGKDKVFGVLMPDGEQKDIFNSWKVCSLLGIHHTTVNVAKVTDALRYEINQGLYGMVYEERFNDIYETNTPARIRMTTLYGIAAILGNSRVANTCNLSEDWVGYSTKYGDSAGDFSPLANLTVHEVKALGYELDLPEDLIEKVPSDGMSGMSDEEKLGFTYEELDTYIRTGKIDNLEHKEKIDKMHIANMHKILLMPKFDPKDI